MVGIHDVQSAGNVHVELRATQRLAVPAVRISSQLQTAANSRALRTKFAAGMPETRDCYAAAQWWAVSSTRVDHVDARSVKAVIPFVVARAKTCGSSGAVRATVV